jgi:hypothetical protein
MTINSQRFVWIAVVMLALTAASFAQSGVVVRFGPPPLPIYAQPLCPGEGYIWTPGFWAWDNDFDDYYWVPGTWVLAPQVGFLWTPGWWGWGGEGFIFHAGYWGPVVGFYGGINYGFGYFGHGYEGGRWENDHFYYNRAVNNVNVTNIHNVYNTTVINNTTVSRVSYNGGHGGIAAQPTSPEQAAARANHIPPLAAQTQHIQIARENPQLRASANQGKPPIAATPKPAVFQGSGVVPAKQAGGRYTPPPNHAAAQHKTNSQAPTPENNQAARPENNVAHPSTAVHPNELPPVSRPPTANRGNAEQDQKYQQQQQQQLRAQQQQERQKLQQQQEQEHQQMAQQKANQAKQQQMEQQHQKQTQQLQQQHQQQQQQLSRQLQQQIQGRQQQAHASQSQPPKVKP